ncbi:TPR-like protein [Exidia glandulosa HHB12029]|uniref:TPR-like protein n=1 Tax=Exidia glandulosa HHB12029 TaxID=1314781 RepID=A0A165QNC9_EXIGL|nr:TPR-like protein [Exidia glandulosa HHB12029]
MANVPLPPESTLDEKMAKLEKTALFMRELPDEPTDDPTIAALQSLLYEGTPDEVAQNFKEQGNEAYKEKRTRDALGFYTQGIGAKPTDHTLLEALLCNRAACNIDLQNYGSVLRDCAKAIANNLQCSKAWYRSALALNALERYEEAIDCCTRCLAYDPTNASVKATLAKAEKSFDFQKRRRAEKAEKERLEKERERAITSALSSRKITVVPKASEAATNEAPPIHFDPDDASRSALVLPVFLLYPQHATSDLISAFHEDTTFGDHLSQMLPPLGTRPDWDTRGEYTLDNVTVYAASRSHRLFRIGKDKTLREAMAAPQKGQPQDGLEIREGCLSFVVLPRGAEEKKWVDNYKKEHPAQAPGR